MKKNTKDRLIKYFVLIIVVAISFFAFEKYYWYGERQTNNAKVNIEKIRNTVVKKLHKMLIAIETIGNDFGFVLETARIDSVVITDLMESIVKYNSDIHGCSVSFAKYQYDSTIEGFSPYFCKNRKGGIVRQEIWSLGDNYFYSHYYQLPALLKHPTWLEPEIDALNTGSVLARYSTPFYIEKQGEPLSLGGVLSLDIDLDWLSDKMNEIRITENNAVFMITQLGTFISYPDKNYVVNESIFTLADEHNIPALRELGREMIKNKSGIKKMYYPGWKEKVWISYAPIPGSNWAIGFIVPEKELFAMD